MNAAGYDFDICVSDADESGEFESPEETVKCYSERKAEAVFKTHTEDVVLSADTVVADGKRILGKPKNEEEAFRMLSSLMGHCHEVFTGVCLMYVNDRGEKVEKSVSVSTKVYFRNATPEEIKAYILTGEPFDKAGAYAIQGKGVRFVEKIEGDWSNVVGLPVCTVIKLLNEAGIRAC